MRWIRYYSDRLDWVGADRMVLIDDGSSIADLDLPISVIDASKPLPSALPNGVLLFRFNSHLGRRSVFSFPGWWRSFTFSSQIAKAYSFSKIIHVESDAFVLSDRMAGYIASLHNGWTSFCCPRYERPESAIQVVCRDFIPTLEQYYSRGDTYLEQVICAEQELPFSNVDHSFIGDRYGEYLRKIPPNADFAAQVKCEMALPTVK